jgi:hypothetical protein
MFCQRHLRVVPSPSKQKQQARRIAGPALLLLILFYQVAHNCQPYFPQARCLLVCECCGRNWCFGGLTTIRDGQCGRPRFVEGKRRSLVDSPRYFSGNIEILDRSIVSPCGLHSSLRQCGGRSAASLFGTAEAVPLSKTVRAWRECPYLRIEIWGTQICRRFRCGPPAPIIHVYFSP